MIYSLSTNVNNCYCIVFTSYVQIVLIRAETKLKFKNSKAKFRLSSGPHANNL